MDRWRMRICRAVRRPLNFKHGTEACCLVANNVAADLKVKNAIIHTTCTENPRTFFVGGRRSLFPTMRTVSVSAELQEMLIRPITVRYSRDISQAASPPLSFPQVENGNTTKRNWSSHVVRRSGSVQANISGVCGNINIPNWELTLSRGLLSLLYSTESKDTVANFNIL